MDFIARIALLALAALVLPPALPAAAAGLAERVERANAPVYRIGGETWVTLPDLAFVLGGDLRRNPVTRRVELAFGVHRAVFLPESSRFLFNGAEAEMPRPLRLINGREAIPLAFADQLTAPGFAPAAQPPDQAAPPPAEDPGLLELLTEVVQPGLEEVIGVAMDREDPLIIIDPGHGGRDAGAVGPYGLKEKDVVLDISKRLQDYLKRRRPTVRLAMTRETDVFIPLEERVRLANEASADLFFCVHANAARLNRYVANGFETFYPLVKPEAYDAEGGQRPAAAATPGQTTRKSRYLASLVQEELSDIFVEEIPNRGAKGRNFFVLRYTEMPAVLVEIGFISNPNIELNLRQPGVRQAIAEALGRGIEAWLDGRALRETPAAAAEPALMVPGEAADPRSSH